MLFRNTFNLNITFIPLSSIIEENKSAYCLFLFPLLFMEKEKCIDEFIEAYSWMVRPCVLYAEEYKDCKSIRSRFHQQFVYGSFVDCSHWKKDYDNCIRWEEENNKNAFRELVENENKRRKEREQIHKENDVWEKRLTPPSDWNDPLPSWMEEKIKTSFLALKVNNTISPDKERTFCVLM